jgi:hypothetical protein
MGVFASDIRCHDHVVGSIHIAPQSWRHFVEVSMNAPLDPVNKAPKRAVVGGRHKPPADNLTGRAGACRILGIDKRELRRLEDQGVLRPAVMQANGVRWFDIDTVWKLAIERQKAGKKPQRRARRLSSHSEGVERVTGAETRQITGWLAAGLSHAEIVLKSGKTHETIRYLYAQYITPSGARLRMTAPSPTTATAKPGRQPPSPVSAPAARRPLRPVPDSWFTDPLPPLPDDDDESGSRRAP